MLEAFEVRTVGGPEAPALRRRIQLAIPETWTVASPPGAAELELAAPDGVGRMLVFAGLHPSHLGPVLDRLRRRHPSAAPSPPQAMELAGLRPELGERATRFEITGREVGEMVLLERGDALVLLVTVVTPAAWPEVRAQLAPVYPTVSVLPVPEPRERLGAE